MKPSSAKRKAGLGMHQSKNINRISPEMDSFLSDSSASYGSSAFSD